MISPKPYICVSALRPEHFDPINTHLEHMPRSTTHDIALGVCIDGHTIAGTPEENTRKLHSLRQLRDISDRIRPEIGKLSIHVECHGGETDMSAFPNTATLMETYSRPFAQDVLAAGVAVDLRKVHSFQFNGTVRPQELAVCKSRMPKTAFICPIGRELVHFGDAAVLEYIDAVRGSIDHLLVDLSAGRGTTVSQEVLQHIIDLARRAAPEKRVGIAGGLGALNIAKTYGPVAARFGPLSMDSETALRNPLTDEVLLPNVFAWLEAAHEALR